MVIKFHKESEFYFLPVWVYCKYKRKDVIKLLGYKWSLDASFLCFNIFLAKKLKKKS